MEKDRGARGSYFSEKAPRSCEAGRVEEDRTLPPRKCRPEAAKVLTGLVEPIQTIGSPSARRSILRSQRGQRKGPAGPGAIVRDLMEDSGWSLAPLAANNARWCHRFQAQEKAAPRDGYRQNGKNRPRYGRLRRQTTNAPSGARLPTAFPGVVLARLREAQDHPRRRACCLRRSAPRGVETWARGEIIHANFAWRIRY